MRRDPSLRRATLPRPVPGAPPVPGVPRAERWTLDNGLKVIAVPHHTLPQVALRVIVPAGSATEPSLQPGCAALVGALLTEGTASLSAEELNRRLDLLGACVEVSVGHDFAQVDAVLLGETLDAGLALLADVLLHPAFPPDEVERVRAETLDALEARADEPANVADDRTAEALFGKDHPYGRLTTGTTESVEALTRAALRDFHAARYRPEGSILVVAGDFEPARLRRAVDAALGGWAGRVPPALYPPGPQLPPAAGTLTRVPWPGAAQGEIRFAGAGMPRTSPDWVPAAVANYLLGGSTITGRLGANLREEKGWTYGVRSGFAAAVQAGGWVVETAVGGEVVDAAIDEIQRELRRFVDEPVSAEELQRARDALILSLPRAFETPGRIAARLGGSEAYGLPADYWERFPIEVARVSVDDVLRVAQRYFRPESLVRVLVGPAREDAA